MIKKLFIIRHAIAEDREHFAIRSSKDDLRPLTDEGREKMQALAKKLYQLHPYIELFAQSPLTRSKQTVDILLKQFKKAERTTLLGLKPTSPLKQLTAEIEKLNSKSLAIIGHEDHLSAWTQSILCKSARRPFFRFKKGGMMLVEYEDKLSNSAQMLWFMNPKALLRM